MSIIISVFFFPYEAFAWGPAAHLSFSNSILELTHLIPKNLAYLISNYRFDYLYGAIAADIIIGKRFTRYIYHCHNFDVGLKLLDYAEAPSQHAFVYGYLSHLAADTVAHNYFIPIQNLKYFGRKHAYWEIRFDQYFKSSIWKLLTDILERGNYTLNDRLLDLVLKDTILSFKTNRVIFSRMLAVQRYRKWREMVRRINKISKKNISMDFISECKKLSVAAIIDFFVSGKDSHIYKVDPTGKTIMKQSKQLKKVLKTFSKKQGMSRKIYNEHIKNFKNMILKTYFS